MATAKSYNLLSQDEFMNPHAVVVSEVEADVCDWNFKIYQDEDCAGDAGSSLVLFFDGYMNPLDYETDDQEEENGFGQTELIRRTVKRFASFNLICDQLRNEYIHRLSCLTNLKLEVRDGGEIYDIKRLDIDRQGVLDGYLVDNVISLYFQHEDFEELGLISCCRPAYTDAPFVDDCPELPGVDGECGDFALLVTESGGNLTATPSDAPGAVEINWLYREALTDPWVLIATDTSSISLGETGHYKAVGTSLGCVADDTYHLQGLCDGVGVTIIDNGAGLVASPANCDSPVYTWYLWDAINVEWDEVFSGAASYVPGAAGVYRVVMTGCGDCVAEAIYEWTGDTTCEIDDILIYLLDGQLIVEQETSEEETYSYEWYLDVGDGPVLVQSGPLNYIDADSEGLYEVYITRTDGCTGYITKVILASETCVLSLSVGVTGDTATAVLDGCGDDPATFTWFRNIGSGFTSVGTGNPFELPGTGLYRLTVTCGECTKSIDFFHCPSAEGDSCKASQYFEDFSGTVLEITEFTLPDTGDYTEKWLRDHVWVFRAAQKVSYNIGFTIDNGTNEITLTWVAENEHIEVYFFADCV